MKENKQNINFIQPAIRFENFRISHVKFENEKPFRKNLPQNLQMGLGYSLHYFRSRPTEFIIDFSLILKAETENFVIEIKADALFTTENEMDNDFKNSQFVLLNAPAIAFPFIRSFIATLTSNAGIPVVLLPSVNFQNLKPEDIIEHD